MRRYGTLAWIWFGVAVFTWLLFFERMKEFGPWAIK
jgi:hypothetical protein